MNTHFAIVQGARPSWHHEVLTVWETPKCSIGGLVIHCLPTPIPTFHYSFFFKKIFLMFIFEREIEHKRGRAERKRETQNPKQPPGSDTGLELTSREIMT